MNKLIITTILVLSLVTALAQEKKIYNPKADAAKDITAAIKKAKAAHKFVLIQAGGNWCKWCIEFARFAKSDTKIDSIMNASFVWYHLNFSKENDNKTIFAKYAFPQRFGFPAFIILNEKGERIHTQNSAYLENGKGSYDVDKVKEFLEMWSPKALDPSLYKTSY
jgi:thioredoxin-related protein